MKLLVAGSRSIKSFDLAAHIPADTELIITGGACGVDAAAERFADEHRISKLVLRPQYSVYRRSAPLKRNEQMVDIADAVLVVWDGRSRGTLHTIEYAKKKNKEIFLIKFDPNTQKNS